MTRADHPSGSDRIAEVAEKLDCGIIVNVQGDLPLLDPTLVDELIEMLRSDRAVGLATVAVPIESAQELANPSVVKVVCATNGHALYFSRSPIPHDRSAPGSFGIAMRHVGIYAYRRDTLLAYAKMAPTPLERTETLEQLRALENGIVIGVVRRAHGVPIEVDTPEDLAAVRKVLSAGSDTRPQQSHGGSQQPPGGGSQQPRSGGSEATGAADAAEEARS
jgi:3-deoxy-manno-octulosonate cytidylyltransferase (CMP-KDO synthetase)